MGIFIIMINIHNPYWIMDILTPKINIYYLYRYHIQMDILCTFDGGSSMYTIDLYKGGSAMATSKKYLVGTQVGQWYILEEAGRNSSYTQLYKARCTRCGYITEHATLQTLQKDVSCMQHIKTKWPNIRLKRIFENMHARCYYPGSPNYNRYGGRGIKICDEWLYDRNKFVSWALENGYRDDLTIDRIDGDSDYTPNNCRWLTQKENNQNKKSIGKYKFNGNVYTLPELSELLAGDPTKLENYRKYHGKEKLTELIDQYKKDPNTEFPNKAKRMIEVDGIRKSVTDWDKYLGTEDSRYIGNWAKKPGRTDEMVAERIRKLLHGETKVKHRAKKFMFNIHGNMLSIEDIIKYTDYFKYSRSVAKRVKKKGFEETEKFLNQLIPATALESRPKNVITKSTLKIKLGTKW